MTVDDNLLTRKQHAKKNWKEYRGGLMIFVAKYIPNSTTMQIADCVEAALDPSILAVQQVFTEQTDFDTLLRPILEAKATVWDVSSGLNDW